MRYQIPDTQAPVLDAFYNLQDRSPSLLYSGANGEFSILGFDPDDEINTNCLESLEQAFSKYSQSPTHDSIFNGGWIGFLSYDFLSQKTDKSSLASFKHYSKALIFNHSNNSWCAILPESSVHDIELEEITQRLNAKTLANSCGEIHTESLASNMSEDEYKEIVEKALEYISSGDIYQVNLARKFSGKFSGDIYILAHKLLSSSPSPFGGFYSHGDECIISTSPERFLSVSGRNIQTRPIKGTRPRLHSDEDKRMIEELLNCEKERAELAMITDLMRNDLGRVCEYGSVTVDDSRRLCSYANVHHTLSVISGVLNEGVDFPELIRATFPGGSVTGAPKIRAMQIIDELETCERGAYCGSLGYISDCGNIDLNILIRSVLVSGDQLSFHTGSGIVADSNPQLEFEETSHKASAILSVLGANT